MRKVKVGYQLDFRNPPGSALSFRDLYRDSLAQAEIAEQLGFDSIWLTEHHFTDDGYLPALMPAAAAVAARTTRVGIGTYVLLAPFYHPLKLAEDAAFVDVMMLGEPDGIEAELLGGLGLRERLAVEIAKRQRRARRVAEIELIAEFHLFQALCTLVLIWTLVCTFAWPFNARRDRRQRSIPCR